MENNNELMDLIQSVQEEQRGIKAEITKMGAKPEPSARPTEATANTCRHSRVATSRP